MYNDVVKKRMARKKRQEKRKRRRNVEEGWVDIFKGNHRNQMAVEPKLDV
jgi:hypothetical protein